VEHEWLVHACRKHPLHQVLVPYDGLDWENGETTLLFETLPRDVTVGRELSALLAGRDLHMDMLREPGRRADAHVARYMLARQFVRPGDRVLDAACGLGYGSALLADGTLAESVLGIDNDAAAVAYATAHYGPRRSRLAFDTRDVRSIADLPAGSLDTIVSFETIEHLEDPEGFVAACHRALTPAGRLICSVPNLWVNATGVDPNPHHLHVFDRAKLEGLCGSPFLIEQVYAQTAGGGMKLPDAERRLWKADEQETGAEWWVAVAMKDVADQARTPVRHGLTSADVAQTLNVLAFDRDYANPWLVRAMIAIGLRTESDTLLADFASRTVAAAAGDSPDAGAALCVQAYRHVGHGRPFPEELRARIADYTARALDVPHARRWQISLLYVDALSALQQGDIPRATRSLEACALSDALDFSALLATKTVSAAFLRGWMALQTGELLTARQWWTAGLNQAERALHRPWEELVMSRESPALFGLREAASIVDMASQCAAGLALSDHASDRPGIVAAQLFESLREQARAVAQPAVVHGPARAITWSLLSHLDQATLRLGTNEQKAKWDLMLDDTFASALMLHPPAILDITIPTGEAGRLETAVAIHPEAWGRPNASACVFSLRADEGLATTIALDPHRREADRRWVDIAFDLRRSSTGTHQITLETRTTGYPDFGWALFRDLTFQSDEREVARRLSA
jgi:SAM-dependent methyltransferase